MKPRPAGSLPTPPSPVPAWLRRVWAALPESSKPDRAWLISLGILLVATMGFAAALLAWLAVLHGRLP